MQTLEIDGKEDMKKTVLRLKQVNWQSILRCWQNNIQGTRQNFPVRSQEGNNRHKIVEWDCLPKTHLLAKTKVQVLEVTPAQWLYPE